MAFRSPMTATGRRLHRTHRTNLPASVRHTAESGAVALACLQLEREPCEPACRVSQRIEQPIARSHSPNWRPSANPTALLGRIPCGAARVGGVVLCPEWVPVATGTFCLLRAPLDGRGRKFNSPAKAAELMRAEPRSEDAARRRTSTPRPRHSRPFELPHSLCRG
jgi:hypothetical protein